LESSDWRCRRTYSRRVPKKAASKAVASEEAKDVRTALRVGRSPLQCILASGKAPTMLPTSETLLLNVEL